MSNINSDKRQVILYGAFDRYNYGDNLMPILLEMYFKKQHGARSAISTAANISRSKKSLSVLAKDCQYSAIFTAQNTGWSSVVRQK